ncbi:response regulator transcription factor [Streptomyces rimosus]|uniref:response regulator transcription factor n=1 Tax=Streptomyces rimosus TaxID=1927 RepID=UPI0007C44A11|nr:LuxR C-terminal-related transcriptional regulator [Streptomyces rimosus]
MPAALRTAPKCHGPAGREKPGRASDLRIRLQELGGDARAADAAVTACLVWVADLLVDIADGLGEPRSAEALVDEAAAVLASAPRRARAVRDPAPSAEPLTGRELAILRRLESEVPLRQIADDLFVSHNTVKSHTRAVYRKLGAHSRAEALRRARERGLLRRPPGPE